MAFIFSIIIPHYDIPELLIRCLRSIPVRDDVQVVVVDDCSPMGHTYLERFPELSRPFLDFCSTDRGGSAGRARNVGMERASGKWLLFADADDFFVPEVNEILDSCAGRDEDILYFKAQSVRSTDMSPLLDRCRWLNQRVDACLRDHDDLFLRRDHQVPWAMIIRKELVMKFQIRFDEVKYANDQMFVCRTGCLAQKVGAVDRVLYVWTQRDGSLTSQNMNKKGELKLRSKVFLNVQKFISQTPYPLNHSGMRHAIAQNLKHGNFLFLKDIHKELGVSYMCILNRYLMPLVCNHLKRIFVPSM